MHGLQTLIVLKRRSLRIISRYPSLSPGLAGLDSERVVFLELTVDLALGLGISGNDEPGDDGGGSGADFLLVRGSGPCEGNLLRAVDSGLEPVRLRGRDGG